MSNGSYEALSLLVLLPFPSKNPFALNAHFIAKTGKEEQGKRSKKERYESEKKNESRQGQRAVNERRVKFEKEATRRGSEEGRNVEWSGGWVEKARGREYSEREKASRDESEKTKREREKAGTQKEKRKEKTI